MRTFKTVIQWILLRKSVKIFRHIDEKNATKTNGTVIVGSSSETFLHKEKIGCKNFIGKINVVMHVIV